MIQKTKNYDLFIFRDDNRLAIDQAHVRKLVESIKSRNLLEFRPIMVNKNMEIIDGQHRLLAAKELGIEIFYQVKDDLNAEDILKVNIAKSWQSGDYLNFYVQHRYPEYLKIQQFMKKNDLNLKITLSLIFGHSHQGYEDFRKGLVKFSPDVLETELSICWETIAFIKKHNGYSAYTRATRFWKALLKLVKHPDFSETRWRNTFTKMVSNFAPMAREQDYLHMFQNIYNYNIRGQKIRLTNQDSDFEE